jgi:hypothetical protein
MSLMLLEMGDGNGGNGFLKLEPKEKNGER